MFIIIEKEKTRPEEGSFSAWLHRTAAFKFSSTSSNSLAGPVAWLFITASYLRNWCYTIINQPQSCLSKDCIGAVTSCVIRSGSLAIRATFHNVMTHQLIFRNLEVGWWWWGGGYEGGWNLIKLRTRLPNHNIRAFPAGHIEAAETTLCESLQRFI